jgi:cell division protein FtsA
MSTDPPLIPEAHALAAALELGTRRTVCWVGESVGDDAVRVLAAGAVPSEGVRAGEVVDVRAAAGCIRAAVDEAERQSGFAVERVCAALAGPTVAGTPSKAAVPITREGQVITPADVRHVLERAGTVTLPVNALRLHILPQSFSVDGLSDVRDPVGLSGAVLEADVVVLSASAFAAENLARATRMADIHLDSLIAAPAAVGLGALNEEERELGALVLDFGSGLTGYSAWCHGQLRACGCLFIGGERITRDIAVGLGTGRDAAEGLKRGSGVARISSLTDEAMQEQLQAPALGGEGPVSFTRRQLTEIIEARVEEILLLAGRRLAGIRASREFGAGAILVGGGARLCALGDMVKQVLRTSPKVGRIRLDGAEAGDLSGPENALGAGLLHWSLAGAPQHELEPTARPVKWLASAVKWLAAGF